MSHSERTERHNCSWRGIGVQSKLGSAEEIETPQGSWDTWQTLWSHTLTSFFCFSPQLLEVLSRTLLKLCPEHRPLWFQLTLLSSKDQRAVVSVARGRSSMFPGWPLVLTPPFLALQKDVGQDSEWTWHGETPSWAFLTGGRVQRHQAWLHLLWVAGHCQVNSLWAWSVKWGYELTSQGGCEDPVSWLGKAPMTEHGIQQACNKTLHASPVLLL